MTNVITPTTLGRSDRIVFEVEKYGVRLGPVVRVIPPGQPAVYARSWVGCLGKHPVSGKRCGLSIYFMPAGSELPESFYVLKETEEYRGIFLPISEMAYYVDLLRNEKPIKVLISKSRADWTQLFTSAYEPPGEGEE